MNDSIKGIRTALQAAPETAEGQTEDAQDGDADTPHDENAASAGTGTGQDASVVEKAVDAVADDDDGVDFGDGSTSEDGMPMAFVADAEAQVGAVSVTFREKGPLGLGWLKT